MQVLSGGNSILNRQIADAYPELQDGQQMSIPQEGERQQASISQPQQLPLQQPPLQQPPLQQQQQQQPPPSRFQNIQQSFRQQGQAYQAQLRRQLQLQQNQRQLNALNLKNAAMRAAILSQQNSVPQDRRYYDVNAPSQPNQSQKALQAQLSKYKFIDRRTGKTPQLYQKGRPSDFIYNPDYLPMQQPRFPVNINQMAQLSRMPLYNDLYPGMLSVFPQWIAKQYKAKQKQSQLLQYLDQPENVKVVKSFPAFVLKSKLQPDQYKWNQQKKEWQGDKVNQFVQKFQQKSKRLTKKLQQNNSLYLQSADNVRVESEVPTVIRQLVRANQSLSQVGFGKISSNSSDLYVGRWLDPATGNIRVLPTANNKYLNPLSRTQKLGYLQAKMINHWNNLITTQQQFKKTVKDDNFSSKAKQRIVQQLSAKKNNVTQNAIISSNIVNFFDNTAALTGKAIIMRIIGQQMLLQIYRLAPDPRQVRQQVLIDRAIAWYGAVDKAYDVAIKRNSDMPSVQRAQYQQKINKAYLDLVGAPGRNIKNGLINLYKATKIPSRLQYDNINSFVESADADLKQISLQTQGILSKKPQLAQLLSSTSVRGALARLVDASTTARGSAAPFFAQLTAQIPQQNRGTVGVLQRARQGKQLRMQKMLAQ